MKIRTATALLGLLVATGASASAQTAAAPATERVQFALQCVQEGSDPRCVSTNYALSLEPGTSSVGNVLTVTPAGYVLEAAEGGTPYSFAADKTLASSYTLVGGSVIKGQVSLRQTGSATTPAAVDSTVSVALNALRVDTRRSVALGSATVNKLVVTSPQQSVYAFEFTVPAALDGVAVRSLSAEISNKQISAGYGFFDGQGGSFFDLPHVAPATVPAG